MTLTSPELTLFPWTIASPRGSRYRRSRTRTPAHEAGGLPLPSVLSLFLTLWRTAKRRPCRNCRQDRLLLNRGGEIRRRRPDLCRRQSTRDLLPSSRRRDTEQAKPAIHPMPDPCADTVRNARIGMRPSRRPAGGSIAMSLIASYSAAASNTPHTWSRRPASPPDPGASQ